MYNNAHLSLKPSSLASLSIKKDRTEKYAMELKHCKFSDEKRPITTRSNENTSRIDVN